MDPTAAAEVTVRPACAGDAASVLALLEAASLPTAGVEAHLSDFVVAEVAGRVVGVAGLERYGDAALLRSVAVDPTRRDRGVGSIVTRRALESAAVAGARKVYLLTTTAEGYFSRHGFRPVERASIPAPVRESVEFTSACPATATALVLDLSEGRL